MPVKQILYRHTHTHTPQWKNIQCNPISIIKDWFRNRQVTVSESTGDKERFAGSDYLPRWVTLEKGNTEILETFLETFSLSLKLYQNENFPKT